MLMKKLLLTTGALVAGATLAFAQGTIVLYNTGAIVTTNGVTPGGATGSYIFEVLDMTQAAWSALSSAQQAAAYNLIANPSAVALWSDTTVSGENSSLHAGGILGSISGGQTAANWGAPSGTAYSTGAIDYYTIVGWSANEGTGWATVVDELNGSTAWNVMGAGGWFGQTTTPAYNYAGGGGPPALTAVSVWTTSTFTGLAGSGGLTGLNLSPIPEPSTMVLAGLGGLSLLLFRRRH